MSTWLRAIGRASRRAFSTSQAPECYLTRLTGADSGIATLTFDRPAQKNAIGSHFLKQFSACIDDVRSDPSVRVLLVRSNVEKVFCAGADLKERREMSQAQVESFVYSLRSTFTSLAELSLPTISVINGAALGGGMEIALATDFRVAGPKSLFGLPETKLAIIPGAGGTQRLPRIIGKTRAKELIFTGKRLDLSGAVEYGIVSHPVPESDPLEAAMNLAREILPQGPIALKMAKSAIDRGMEVDLSSGLALEQACYGNVIPTKDRTEGLNAFREKRKPVYKGE